MTHISNRMKHFGIWICFHPWARGELGMAIMVLCCLLRKEKVKYFTQSVKFSLKFQRHNQAHDILYIMGCDCECCPRGSHSSVWQDPRINLNKALVISSVVVACCSCSSSESVWLLTTLHPNRSVCELDGYIPNRHIGCEEVLQSVDTITRHAIKWITHRSLIRVQFIPYPTENSSISTCTLCILVYLWNNEKNDESLK